MVRKDKGTRDKEIPRQIKREQQAKIGVCCPCGKKYPRPTQSHHLFFRRVPDIHELWHSINIVQTHSWCNCNESFEMQVTAALWKIEEFGCEAIEAWAASLPGKTKHDLRWHYWEAKELYLKGEKDVSI